MQTPALAHCYKCDGSSTSECSRCGRVFCAAHGGERLVSQSAPFSRFTVSWRVVCDECTPSQAMLKFRFAVLVVLALAAGSVVAIMTYNLQR